jgi:hypothetical protein
MPCNLDAYLTAYLAQTGIRNDAKGSLFSTIGRGTRKLTATPLPQANAYAMIRRRAAAVGIATKVGNHSFRASGITTFGLHPHDLKPTVRRCAKRRKLGAGRASRLPDREAL